MYSKFRLPLVKQHFLKPTYITTTTCFLLQDLEGSIRKIADHLGKSLSDDVIKSIAERVTFAGMQKTYKNLEDKLGEEGKKMTHMFGVAPYLRKGKPGTSTILQMLVGGVCFICLLNRYEPVRASTLLTALCLYRPLEMLLIHGMLGGSGCCFPPEAELWTPYRSFDI